MHDQLHTHVGQAIPKKSAPSGQTESHISLQVNDRAENVPTYHRKRDTADMTQDDFFVIAILEMCTDPELSKSEVKTDELT